MARRPSSLHHLSRRSRYLNPPGTYGSCGRNEQGGAHTGSPSQAVRLVAIMDVFLITIGSVREGWQHQ
jgi:hypothetical protein